MCLLFSRCDFRVWSLLNAERERWWAGSQRKNWLEFSYLLAVEVNVYGVARDEQSRV